MTLEEAWPRVLSLLNIAPVRQAMDYSDRIALEVVRYHVENYLYHHDQPEPRSPTE